MTSSTFSFRLVTLLLFLLWLFIVLNTLAAARSEGWDFLNSFLQTCQKPGWNAQFLADFSCYLLLSGLWLMWRHRFSPLGIGAGIVAMILGYLVFAPYLLVLFYRSRGDVFWVLTGTKRPGVA